MTTKVCGVVKGWRRELTRECVEPNPGPTLDEILTALKTKLGPKAVLFTAMLQNFENKIQAAFPADQLVLVDSDVRSYIATHDADMQTIFGNSKAAIIQLFTEVMPAGDTKQTSIQQKFTQLLARTHKNRPDARILNTIVRRFSSRLAVCETPDDALDLYEDAELQPESETRLLIMEQHNIIVNGPLSIDGKAFILSGSDINGKPLIIKVLDPARASVEINNVHLVQQADRPQSIPEITDISVTLPSTAAREMRGRVGEYKALVMPRFISTVIEQVQLPEQAIYEHVQDIVLALQYIHNLGYVYMDVKGSNIIVSHTG